MMDDGIQVRVVRVHTHRRALLPFKGSPPLPSPPASRHAVQARQKRPVVESVAITTPTHVACRMPSHSWTWSDSDAYAYGTLGRARASAIGHPSGPTGKHHPNVSTVGRVAAAAPNCQCHHDLSDSTRARRAELGVYMGLSPHLRPVPLSAFVGLIALRMHVYCGIFVFMVLVVHHGPGGWRDVHQAGSTRPRGAGETGAQAARTQLSTRRRLDRICTSYARTRAHMHGGPTPEASCSSCIRVGIIICTLSLSQRVRVAIMVDSL